MRVDLDDTAVLAVIEKLLKQRKDSIAQYGRQSVMTRRRRAYRSRAARRLHADADVGRGVAAEVSAAVAATGAKPAPPTWAR